MVSPSTTMGSDDSLFEKSWKTALNFDGATIDGFNTRALMGQRGQRRTPIDPTINPLREVIYPLLDDKRSYESRNRLLRDRLAIPRSAKDSFGDYNTRLFRNNQFTGRNTLPSPTLIGGEYFPALGGMHSLQRRFDEDPQKLGRFTTLAASNATPLDDPRFNVSRGAQSRSHRVDGQRKADGKKNEHMWVHGNLGREELSDIMSGGLDQSRLLQDWGDDVDLFRDKKGAMQGWDKETGRPLIMVGYDFSTPKNPNLTPKEGKYSVANREYREDVDDYDWRDRIGSLDTDVHTDGVPYSSKVTGSIDPIMRILDELGRMPSYRDSSGFKHQGVPVPMNIGSNPDKLGLKQGLVTPTHGILARESDFTNTGRDVLENAMLGQIINLSEDNTFEDAWGLIKAVFDSEHWGQPGEMFFWDELFGGEFPKAVTYPWNKDKQGNYGPPRPEGQMYGGGNRDIIDFVNLFPEKVQQLTGTKDNPNLVDYPLEGMDIPAWEGSDKQSKLMAGFGSPGKMPGISLGDMPVHACTMKTGACKICYAAQNKMAFNGPQRKYHRNLYNSLNDMPKYLSAMQNEMYSEAMKTANNKRNAPKHLAGKGFVRGKASGDFRGPGEVSAYFDLLQQQNPRELRDLEHWISSRQAQYIREAMEARGGTQESHLPDNATMRISIDREPEWYKGKEGRNDRIGDIASILESPGITTSTITPKGFGGNSRQQVCPASLPGAETKCDLNIDPLTGEMGCRMCFRRENENTSYMEHGQALDDIFRVIQQNSIREAESGRRIA